MMIYMFEHFRTYVHAAGKPIIPKSYLGYIAFRRLF
jgi:predicted transport protein